MNNISDFLIQLQKLTRQNLDILKSINDSFFSKQTHLNVKVGDSTYAMPSFIYLENKINSLQANFENLVNSPRTGEAFFNFDGNSRAIEVRGFTNTPNSIKMDKINGFEIQQNDIFKDFLTPVPFFKVDLKTIPNDICEVNVKKVIPRNPKLIEHFETLVKEEPSANYSYADLYKILTLYKEDIDYVEYDAPKKLPIRKNVGTGTYVIESVLKDEIDEHLDEYITIRLRSNLKDDRAINTLSYKLFDETIFKQLVVGDCLITYNDGAKLEIVEIFKNTNTIKVKVLYGEFLNLTENKEDTNLDDINDMCKLRFFSDVDADEYKYINIPLEEDRLVFISVAPLNSRMNIQASWGTGLIINTDKLRLNGVGANFTEYYKENVKNIGDILYEVTATFNSQITALGDVEYKKLMEAPSINMNDLEVIQINRHLNNSPTVQNIRTLYSQKKRYNTELQEIQTSIDNINAKLSSISFDDTSGMRSVYVAQLSEFNTKKNELTTSISKVIDEISIAANESEIPIENAKYHIRGFFDYLEHMKMVGMDAERVIGIEVQYRYKNVDQPQGSAQTISDKFLYSDWNLMDSFINYKHPVANKVFGGFSYEYPDVNGDKNEPSLNQIDIPITQGETVDIKLRLVYDFGFPFIKTVSNWSDIVNVEFPKEYLKDVQILDIISENNNDIETNRFNNIIREQGIPNHIEDRIVDQDLTYFHRPENIASGFYTNERRIIPLKDKLSDMDNTIKTIQDEVMGSNSEALSISINSGDVNNKLYPFQVNQIGVESYNIFASDSADKTSDGVYMYNPKTKIVSTILNLVITNTSQHTVKLFSMFPGGRDNSIAKLNNVRFDKKDYTDGTTGGVWINYDKKDAEGKITSEFKLQTANQYVTFRINDPFNGEVFYKKDAKLHSNHLPLTVDKYKEGIISTEFGTIMYPKIREEFALCMNNDTTNTYRLLVPNESIVIPLLFEYKLSETYDNVSKTMSLDIRPSLYGDPINYTFCVTAKIDNTTQDKLITTSRRYVDAVKYNTTVTK